MPYLYPYPHNDRLNSADLHQSQEHPLAKVGWTCPPQSTLWQRPWDFMTLPIYVCQDRATKDARLRSVCPEFQPLLGRTCAEMTDCCIWPSCAYKQRFRLQRLPREWRSQYNYIRRSSGTNCCHVPHNWLVSFPRDQSHLVRALSVCTTKTSWLFDNGNASWRKRPCNHVV